MSLASAESAASDGDVVSFDTTPRPGPRATVGGTAFSPTSRPASLGYAPEMSLGPKPQRRRRSSGETASEEAKRYCLDPPRPQRDSAPQGRISPASPTFADAARRTPPASPDSPMGEVQGIYPPPPCAYLTPCDRRFNPDRHYYLLRYLSGLEKESGVSGFAYSLPADKNMKVAIRGLPADTDPQEIEEELKSLGHQPVYVRHIKGAQGRPGCVFHAILKQTPDVRSVYDTTVFMNMRGVKIEAWWGKRGPAQCHRCQRFRHSSQQCHRPLACVRCGGEHAARDCPRPREEPATCVNCGGPHPACNIKCPVFQAEIRNKRAGTVASTTTHRPKLAVEVPTQVRHVEAVGPTLMAPANEPTPRTQTSSSRRRKRNRGKKGKKTPNPPATQEVTPLADPAPAQVVRTQVVTGECKQASSEPTTSAIVVQRQSAQTRRFANKQVTVAVTASAARPQRQNVERIKFTGSASGGASIATQQQQHKEFTA